MTEADRPEVTLEGEELAKPAGSSPEDAPEVTEDGADTASDAAPDAAPDAASLQAQLAERTADLQRVQAEYLNYKRRVERDRELVRQTATYAALVPIVEVLDTIDRAREHAERSGQGVEGDFKVVAEQLERVVAGVGLVKFGAVGDPFDPNIHEALSHIGEDPDVTVTTCKVIAKAGYRIGDRVVRAAQVLVVDPPSGAGAGADGSPTEPFETPRPSAPQEPPVEVTAADDVQDDE